MTDVDVPREGGNDGRPGSGDSLTIPPGALARLTTPCTYLDWQEAESRKYAAEVRILRLSSGTFALFDAGWNLYAVLNGSYLLAELPIQAPQPRQREPLTPQLPDLEFDL